MIRSQDTSSDLDTLSLSTRAKTLLDIQLDITTVSELLEFRRAFATAAAFKSELLKIPGFGVAIVNQIESAITTFERSMPISDQKQIQNLNTQIGKYESEIETLREKIAKTLQQKTLLINQTIKRHSK